MALSNIYHKLAGMFNPDRNFVQIKMTTRFDGRVQYGAAEFSANVFCEAPGNGDGDFATVVRHNEIKTKGDITTQCLTAQCRMSQAKFRAYLFTVAMIVMMLVLTAASCVAMSSANPGQAVNQAYYDVVVVVALVAVAAMIIMKL